MRTLLVWVAVCLLATPSAMAQNKPATAKKPKKPAAAKKPGGQKTPAKKPKEGKKLPAPTHAYTGLTLHDGTGKVIPNATLLVGQGKIVAAGPAAKVKIPPGVYAIALKGKQVIPGLIDANSRLFLASASEARGSSTVNELKDGLNLFDRNARSALRRGVTSVHLAPTGPRFGGQGVLVKLTPDGAQTGAVAVPNAGVTATYVLRSGASATPAAYLSVYDRYKAELERAVDYKEKWDKYEKKLKKYKQDLAAWEKKEKARKAAEAKKKADGAKKKADGAKKKADGAKKKAEGAKKKAEEAKKKAEEAKKKAEEAKKKAGGAKKKAPTAKGTAKKPPAPKAPPKPKEPTKPKEDKRLAVLMHILQGKRTLMLMVDAKEDIESALKLAERYKITVTLVGATEAHLVAKDILKGKHRVLLGPATGPDISNVGRMNQSADAAASLAKAGVPVGIGSDGSSGRVSRYVRFFALRAIAEGLPGAKALQTVTRDAAKAVGVENRVGTLTQGKDADFVVLDGTPFVLATQVERVYIDGKLAYRRKK